MQEQLPSDFKYLMDSLRTLLSQAPDMRGRRITNLGRSVEGSDAVRRDELTGIVTPTIQEVIKEEAARDFDTAPESHQFTHENNGSDEINVEGLSGLLADPQTPIKHASRHETGGDDEIFVQGLHGQLEQEQEPWPHADEHRIDGLDPIDVVDLGGMLVSNISHGEVVFSASGGMTWTVDSGDVIFIKYARIGKISFIWFRIEGTTIVAPVSDSLIFELPDYVPLAAPSGSVPVFRGVFAAIGVVTEFGTVSALSGTRKIILARQQNFGGPNWVATVDGQGFEGHLVWPTE